jgi:uncharacterized membrane protein
VNYHETFWVVVGTSAPVILLALVVSATQILRTFVEWPKRDRVTSRRWRGVAIAATVFTAVSFLFTFVLLWVYWDISLRSLEDRADWGNTDVVRGRLDLAVLFLLLTSCSAALMRFAVRAMVGKGGTADSNETDDGDD